MGRIIVVLFSILLFTQTYASAAVTVPARLSLVSGDVMFITPDADDWEPAAVNMPLDEGDAVWCPDGAMAELQLPDGSMVRLDGGSQLNLLANEDGFMHLNLASGRLYVKTVRNGSENSLQIDADDTTVVPAPGTRLGLAMLPNAQEDVSIFTGSAHVEGNEGRTRVRAGEQISMEEYYSELLPLNPPDSWENWNLDRDRQQSMAADAAAYLPEELRSFSGELDANGRWVRTADYGMVWRPTVVLSGDWAPYRSGRWAWRGADYVWIPAESWGWVPYHYGRWTVISNYGWCWVPPARGDVYWGPGYVGWYRTGSHVGWTPLAPGEIYYGYGNHGRNSINITTVNVNVKSVNYRNRRHRGGTTIVAQNDFLRGRIATVQPARTASVTVALGSPRIKPPRDSRPATVRRTQSGQTPPRIEPQFRGELRHRFPRVNPPPVTRQAEPGRPQVSTPVRQQQTPVRSEERRRRETTPAERQIIQQPAPVTVPPQRQQPQRQEAAPPRPEQNQVRPEQNRRREAAPADRQIIQQPAPVSVPQQRQRPQRRVATPAVPQQNSVRPEQKPSQEATPAARQIQQQPAPVTAPQQRQQPQRRGAAPAAQQQTPARQEDNSRQGVAPAERQKNQQAAPVNPPQQRQQPQRQGVTPAVQQQTPVPQDGTARQEVPRRDQKQKKVWRVKTHENGKEKAPKETEEQEKDAKEKALKERQ